MAAPLRRLRVTERTVAPARDEAYGEAWARVRESVTRAGGNAWGFRMPGTGRRLEFIEGRGTHAVPQDDDVRAARAELERLAPATMDEEWEEA